MITGTCIGDRELSDARTCFTRFILLNERSSDGYTWSGWRLKRKQIPPDPTMCDPMCGSIYLIQQNAL